MNSELLSNKATVRFDHLSDADMVTVDTHRQHGTLVTAITAMNGPHDTTILQYLKSTFRLEQSKTIKRFSIIDACTKDLILKRLCLNQFASTVNKSYF